ncbi:DUF5682 family protein [Cognatiyoonia sp. IB215446]|uniref:DUF5682 family protein n=1 Tax=Cognatiyoonia sp. IB215446 TaxID=3097355 RepID=UPI002A0FF410|nr:DUF5682 family protein [Cognatiyoonia sp. IB215446]MDX8350245.1 DUF5682 family protein [Cognatiyoonia sp. IB215446]
MTEHPSFEAIADALFQPKRGIYVVPIRHHSPACAWYLKKLIAEIKPKRVLIEAPQDFANQIPLLLDKATRPPVALVSLVDPKGDQPRVAGYYPFCGHSPEFVALQDGHAIGATLEFIDAPAADKAMRLSTDAAEPVALASEAHFNTGDYIKALARHTGCRDGFELWDHLFEARIGGDDWRAFFCDTGIYCAGIRAATSEAEIKATGDANREAHMARAVRKALEEGGPVVVIVGGFHAPALVGDLKDIPKTEKTEDKAESYLIRYGFRALDALNGYGAGLPQPGYYQALWDRTAETQDWRGLAIDLLSDFSNKLRDDGAIVALPTQTEAIRMAEALAHMRGRPGAMRHDLIDGIQAAFIKGETSGQDAIITDFQAFLCGDDMGDVPASAGSPPLVEDVRRRASNHRFDISDSAQRRRKLDIRRKDFHLDASQFCHALSLIGSPFAGRNIGPDYITGARTELLFEEWLYAWSPQVEGHLIQSAVLGDSLPTACLAYLARARGALIGDGKARDLPEMVTLLSRGLLAGLGERLAPFASDLAGDIGNYGTFSTVTQALQRLMFLQRSSGPLRVPAKLDLQGVVETAYRRLVYLCDELPRTTEEQVADRLDALRLITEILRGTDYAGLDRDLLNDALDRAADEITEPVILGAVLAVCVQAGLRQADELVRAVEGRLTGVSLDLPARIGVLRGILHSSPTLIRHAKGLLPAVDTFLCGLDAEEFLELLPHLRLAFTALNPRDTDHLAEELARMHDIQAGQLLSTSDTISEADLTRALAIEQKLHASLQQDGLTTWIGGAS